MRKSWLVLLIFIGVIILLLVFILTHKSSPASSPSSAPSASVATSSGVLGTQGGCKVENGLPDKFCTPGEALVGVTKDQICISGYAKSVRNVPESEKDEVYKEYGITSHTTGEFEVDHLISLELGGSNDLANLWPEPTEPRPGFHEKDKVENYLHSQVCSGAITLEEAQKEISTNWLGVYQSMQ